VKLVRSLAADAAVYSLIVLLSVDSCLPTALQDGSKIEA
jgi:hypothetical protein